MTLIDPRTLSAVLMLTVAFACIVASFHTDQTSTVQYTASTIFFGLLCGLCLLGVVVCLTPLWGVL